MTDQLFNPPDLPSYPTLTQWRAHVADEIAAGRLRKEWRLNRKAIELINALARVLLTDFYGALKFYHDHDPDVKAGLREPYAKESVL